ncbi:uncharacterized protein LOC121641808 [Melanotaenia boesemani]|uniref:uncharacterized protein LOC121641808 n=1 Tax=Melanotaenia boesemani TaxID=1250792 RepID=UPI001C05E9CF|nr:uncharacterized protein LOC121641808 [Melanotaenia boesemani]
MVQVRELMKMIRLSDTKKNRRKIIRWMQKRGILRRTVKCVKCNRRMHLVTCHVKDGLWWVCKHHRSSPQSVRNGSIFTKSHIPLIKWLEFMHRFAQGLQLKQLAMITDGIAASSRTLTRMAKVLRKVCIAAVKRLRKRGMRIGGRHRFVVIDQSKFAHKRKYHRGRCGNTWRRERQWVFGMLEVEGKSRRPILRLVRDRTRKTLIGKIRHHIRPRTSILTDEWRAYKGQLAKYGYDQYSVCHKKNFVDHENGAHTQHIERAWQNYKLEVWRHRGNRTLESLKLHLKMIEWHHWLGVRHYNGVLGRLFHDVKKQVK